MKHIKMLINLFMLSILLASCGNGGPKESFVIYNIKEDIYKEPVHGIKLDKITEENIKIIDRGKIYQRIVPDFSSEMMDAQNIKAEISDGNSKVIVEYVFFKDSFDKWSKFLFLNQVTN